MSINRVEIVDRNFRTRIQQASSEFQRQLRRPEEPLAPGSSLTQAQAVELLECQLTSRWLDCVARELKAEGKSFYTIGSAGHEGNAMLGQLTRPSDTAFLHYRSGAFVMARARQVPGETPIFDTCLSLTASLQDPTAGGRHKVWGSLSMNIPPQTSTIASHLPKSVGYAFFLDRRKRLGLLKEGGPPADSIAVCSFGDATVNHSTAAGALNAAAWVGYQRLPIPILFVCEDNGLGISVKTPIDWVEANFSIRRGLKYFQADGLDIFRGYSAIEEAIRYCRERRQPVFLHLRVVRLLGHAGSDIEVAYEGREAVEAREAQDPIIRSALGLIRQGVMSAEEILHLYESIAGQVRAAGQEAASRPRHESAESVMAPLRIQIPPQSQSPIRVDAEQRRQHWGGKLPEQRPARQMAQLINWGLHDLMLSRRGRLIFGQDVARKGGVYNVTAGLYEKFGLGRVFNTLLDEQTILGMGIGAGQLGLTAILEIQ
ncbi:MAG: thiamine pyrophosphate-dependent enzyme, partial [Acidobacteriota bacterium]